MRPPYPPCRLQVLKYPRREHQTLESYVLRNQPTELILYTPAGATIHAGTWQAIVPAALQSLHFFWPGRHYNAEMFWTAAWQFRGYYLNAALPHEWDGAVCTYVDLELDISHFEGEEIRVLDRDQYDAMRVEHGLPENLAAEVEQFVIDGQALLEGRRYPFDGSLQSWRPSVALPVARM
jgi:protein associated with RNAse G/E